MEIKRLERVQSMRKVNQEIRREATWFKIAFVSIGLLIGVPVGGLFSQSNPDLFQKIPLLSQPFGQSQTK